MKIGMIGAGHIGGTLGALLSRAGHQVQFGVRDPKGRGADFVTVDAAAQFGEVVIFAGPFGAWPDFARDTGPLIAGKVVITAANPVANRDGAVASAALASGDGSAGYIAALLPQTEVVQAFNTIYWVDLRDKAGQPGEKLAMPIAGDSARGKAVAAQLAQDAGFDPVDVGGLDRSALLDPGSAIYAKSLSAATVRKALGLSGGAVT